MCDEETIPVLVKPTENIIKVIGVGGGGGNAVNHMYREGIHDVTFVVCNTDKQALDHSPIPEKLQLGKEGLGAGNRPNKAKASAEESIDDIKQMLDDGSCKMVFITAGMGGGTGTGAAPVIAQAAKEMGILTVGIVTIPFIFEGIKKIDQALDGVEEMSKHVDALLVINNERLRSVYSDCTVKNAFAKADDTLTVAAKSIAEIITMTGSVNLDFNDVKTVLKDGGVAIMSTGYGEGEGRVTQAINDALNSPLLNNNDIYHSKKLLFKISDSKNCELMMSEVDEIHEFMSRFDSDLETKYGIYSEEGLDKKVKFTILATGFGVKDVYGFEERAAEEQKALDKKEEEARQKAIEEQIKKEDRRNSAYGSDAFKSTEKFNIYIFSQDDLDNEDIISMVESTPTYKRRGVELGSIKEKSERGKQAPVMPETSQPEAQASAPNTIKF